jgi:hypothetical protein
MAGKRMCVQQ